MSEDLTVGSVSFDHYHGPWKPVKHSEVDVNKPLAPPHVMRDPGAKAMVDRAEARVTIARILRVLAGSARSRFNDTVYIGKDYTIADLESDLKGLFKDD